jgi:hypothetical protein
MAAAASSNSELATNARFKMNSFVKKSIGVLVLWQLAVLVWSAPATMNFGVLPLWFEARGGPADSQYVAHGRDSEFMISPAGAEMVLREAGGKTVSTRMQFVGGNPYAEMSGDKLAGGKINYLIGNDPTHWQADVPAFGQVQVDKIYPGINVVYYGNQQRLEYDFNLAAGANPEAVAIRFTGADSVKVNAQGDLVVKLDGREVIQHQPVAYQTAGGIRRAIQVGYKIRDDRTVGFAVGNYDSRLPLVIDPVLGYATFFGGNGGTVAWKVALGTNDNSVYITGSTLSTKISNSLGFATPGAFQSSFQGGTADGDAFVAKFNSVGGLVYCTYLGGSVDDAAYAIAVDSEGHAFVAGATDSANFPVKNAVVGVNFNGSKITTTPTRGYYPSSAFVSELQTDGGSLIYSTYLGGSTFSVAFGIALDAADDAFVTGETFCNNYPVTTNAFQSQFASTYDLSLGCNAFVTEVAPGGNTLKYSTYLGGTNQDIAYGISFNNGYLAVAGWTCSSNFPTTNWIGNYTNSYNQSSNGQLLNGQASGNINNTLQLAPYVYDAFVTLFQTSGANVVPLYSTFLGGTNEDMANAVAVDASGTVFVVGGTSSINFPNSTNLLSSYVLTNTLSAIFVTNTFLTQIKWNGTNPTIGFSQVFGGLGNDIGYGVALDAAENVFIAGSASSVTNYNANPENLIGSLSWTNSGGYDAFVTAFKSDFSGLLYSADFGSSYDDSAYGIAVDSQDSVYVAGRTYWTPRATIAFPVFNAWESSPPGSTNAFLAKIWLGPQLTAMSSGTNLLVSWPAQPQAQIGTNTFYLEAATNLLSMVVTTNLIPPIPPATQTNELVITNWVAAPDWTPVPQLPTTTTNGVTTFIINPTGPDQFFRMEIN